MNELNSEEPVLITTESMMTLLPEVQMEELKEFELDSSESQNQGLLLENIANPISLAESIHLKIGDIGGSHSNQ